MKNSIKKNYLINSTYQFFALMLPLITTPYISRVLGAEGVGIHSKTFAIASLFALCCSLGTESLGRRQIAFFQENIEKRSISFYNIFFLRILSCIIGSLFYFYIFRNSNLRNIYYIQGMYIIIKALDITWFFQGIEEFKLLVLRNIFIKIIGTICIFLFVKSLSDLWIYCLILSVSQFIGSISIIRKLFKYINVVKIKSIHIFANIKEVTFFFIPSISIQLSSMVDKIMLGYLGNNISESGYYDQSQRIPNMCIEVLITLSTVMIPKIADSFVHQDKVKIKYYMLNSYRVIIMLGIPIMFGLISISSSFVPWFFGTGYEEVIKLIKIFSLLVIPIGMNNISGVQYLSTINKEKYFTIIILIGTIINIILNIFFIPLNYAIGAAWATVISELIMTVLYFIYIKDIINFKSLLNIMPKYCFSGLIMFLIVNTLKKLLGISIIFTFIEILVGILVYFFMLLLLKEEWINKYYKSFLKRVIKK